MNHRSNNILDDNSEVRFIPVDLPELIKGLLGEKPLQDSTERNAFARFSELLQALYHTHYFERYRDLKRYYQPFNPDQDTTSLEVLSGEGRDCYQKQLFHDLKALLQKANYDELTETLINESLTQTLSKNLSIAVEMEDFSQVLFFSRGQGVQKNTKRNWHTLFLTHTMEEVVTYQRLCVAFKFQSEEKLRESLKKRGMSRFAIWRHVLHHRAVMESDASQDYIFLRLFRDVPKSDLEMLFPNSKIHFTFFDKIKLGITGGAGTLGGLWALFSKLALAIKPLAILMALVGFGSIVSRHVRNVLHHQNNYKVVLSRSLYSHSLDINVGVISSLIDQAREEEIKESLLAYYFLMRVAGAGYYSNDVKKGMTQKMLDQKIETHLMMRYGVFLNFDVEDAVTKLKIDGLVHEDGEGYLRAVSIEEASTTIVSHWEDIFSVAKRLSLLGKV